MSEELKRCPFCKCIIEKDHNHGINFYLCPNCGACVSFRYAKDAVASDKLWNNRADTWIKITDDPATLPLGDAMKIEPLEWHPMFSERLKLEEEFYKWLKESGDAIGEKLSDRPMSLLSYLSMKGMLTPPKEDSI
jgi:uncharacterized C2H2 Zn-finger protein